MRDYIPTAGGVLMPAQNLAIGGVFRGQLIRDGEVIDEFEDHNLVVDQGLNKLLDVMFNGSGQITNWYLGLFEGNYTPVAGLTAANVAANATECVAYDEAARPGFTGAAAAGKVVTNSAAKATFTFNATKNVYGAFLISDATKGGTSGVLFSAARFTAAKAVVATDQLLLTYTFTGSSS